FDLHGFRRFAVVAAGLALLIFACSLGRRLPGAWDLTEVRRHSLPSDVARALAELPGRVEIDADLDREDSRRRQLEADALARWRLARPDLRVRWLPDERRAPSGVESGEGYGQLTVRLGDRSVRTMSTSRRELTTLLFELAGRTLPDWNQPE